MGAGLAGEVFGTFLALGIMVWVIVMAIKGTIKKEREKQAKKRNGK